MFILGIDTATPIASVGITRDGAVLAEESLPERTYGQQATPHTETLLPLIGRVLAQAGVTLAEIEGIGVSIGPGSFTGLRIALGTVKGFAYAMGQKVVGVPTLEALARTVSEGAGLVCPLLDARKGEVYAALFRRAHDGTLTQLLPDQVLLPQQFLGQITEPCLFLGDGTTAYRELIQRTCGALADILPFTTHHPRGAIIARMAWERLQAGGADDLQSVVPVYVRAPEAVVKRGAVL
jgi:tRNA threonylcarbamoyladenosine biosynthesis protein TsaB